MATAMHRAAIFLLLAAWGAGCQGQGTESSQGDEPEPTSAASPARVERRDVDLRAIVDVQGPEGWVGKAEPRGERWASAGGDAQLFFGTLRSAEEPRALIESLAGTWGVSDIRWAEEQALSIGADRLPATGADGACTTRGGEATIAYASADTGQGTVLVAYVLDRSAKAEVREAAMTAVASFKKR